MKQFNNNNEKQPKPVIKTIYTLINKKKMKDKSFTYAKIVKLIHLYQKNECLWNISSPDFRRQVKRTLVLSQIAKEFDVSPAEIKRKIRSLRATYLLERRKVLASEKKIRDGLEKYPYEPMLVWYKYMSFLNDVIVFRIPTAAETSTSGKSESAAHSKDAEQQENDLEKVEEIYYNDDGGNFKHEAASEMATEYLEANYLCEDTVDQVESIDVSDDAADFLMDDFRQSPSKSDQGNLERENDDLESLKAERIRTETEYFRKKAQYIDLCMERERKLQPLLVAKLKLEIENLSKRRNDYEQ